MNRRVRRAVVVHRPTDFQLLLSTHGTRGQAEFFLRERGQSIEALEQEHARVQSVIERALGQIPPKWRRASIGRSELSRFLFEPDDVVIPVGQDGLVANVAKYLSGQPVVGINPLPDRFDGVLVRHLVDRLGGLLTAIDAGGSVSCECRTMVQAGLDDGQVLVALNEIFVGHRSHQSARYRITIESHEERQSSSGLICCSGTGATGWASSITRAAANAVALPRPTESRLSFFVREAWPGKGVGTGITVGNLGPENSLVVRSEMNQGGVIFGDGIEEDYLPFEWGRVAKIGIAAQKLNLVA